MAECDYYQCEEPSHGPKPMDSSWHLCESHQAQLEEIVTRQPFDPKALVGFWARGKGKEQFMVDMEEPIKKMADSLIKWQESQ